MPSLRDCFESNVYTIPFHECWEWSGYIAVTGYGQLRYAKKLRYAHRVSYELNVGEIPDGMCVCHKCDNRSCVNPAHLWIGTKSDNQRDMKEKGRAHGPLGGVRLTDEDVREIRASVENNCALARRYGVSHSHVSRVKRGLKRQWVD